jgi:hypothetical protein
MGIEIIIKCARCNKEVEITPPLLFKYPTLEITVFRCKCKDAELEGKYNKPSPRQEE